MANRNNCSSSCTSGSLRNSCHIPASSNIALCSTNMGCGEVFCVPSNCQDHTWFMDNCPETFAEPISGQPPSREASGFENSCCSSAYCVPRPCHGSGYLPTTSFISGSCLPASYRPVSYVSSSCRPVSPFMNSCRPVSCGSGGYRPLPCVSNSCRPVGIVTYGCRPSGCVTYGPQTIHIVSNSLRPLQPVCGGCQPAIPVFGSCRPSCSAQGEIHRSPSCRNSSHVPVTSPVTSGLCSTETRGRDAPCSPTSSLGSNTPQDNCQEPCEMSYEGEKKNLLKVHKNLKNVHFIKSP
ncbi:rCG58737 [Rattus norvegicus]|uniref:Keratin-associated protein n=1 Tax=Rattus norvegicus TaxID=10116 RepID=A6JL95_RAT|nr:rCG58737 [Rattus norvegicus]